MKKSVFSLVLALAGVGITATSCQEMLAPEMDRYAENFSGKDTVNFYLGIMRELQSVSEQQMLLGELRGDLVASTDYVSDSISDIMNFRNLQDGENALLNAAAYYKVINQCNHYIARADSMAMKNNSYYMRRELAQVELVRAWTYMQLVQNYGRVPFITAFVGNSNTGWETNPSEGWATPDNLLSLLEEKGGLKQAYAYSEALGYINYGNFNNGASTFNHSAMTFNGDLIYGDLYLLRGGSQGDYEKAAYYYHRYLDKRSTKYVSEEASVLRFQRGNEDRYSTSTSSWLGNVGSTNSFSGPYEYISSVPTASNSSFGLLLTRVPQVYGYDVKSTTASTTTTSNNTSTTTAYGNLSVTANYRNRQVEPSNAYLNLNQNQVVVYNDYGTSSQAVLPNEVRYPSVADARLHASAPIVSTDKGRIRFIQKYVSAGVSGSNSEASTWSFAFRMGIPLYRLRQVYLRYAEAVNRAGYPRYAFAILRDGLHAQNIPTLSFATTTTPNDTVWADPTTKQDIETVVVHRRYSTDSIANGANGIDFNERQRASKYAWLNFTDFISKKNVGIHEAGSGTFTDKDTVWIYDKVVAQRIKDEAARLGVSATAQTPELLATLPDTTYTAKGTRVVPGTTTIDNYDIRTDVPSRAVYGSTAQEIAAVETLIADELALETAFEGFRYYDLMRIARHRNNAGEDGTQWMAWLISRRDQQLKPYENPTQTGSLFSYLNNVNNWYLPLPTAK